MNPQKTARSLTDDALKLIAMAAMLVDHIGVAMMENVLAGPLIEAGSGELGNWALLADLPFRMVGRIAFPIFCYLLVQGFLHTRSAARYAARLAVFAAISEAPYDLMVFGRLTSEAQNVFFTLVIGLLMMIALRSLECGRLPARRRTAAMAVCVLAAMALAYALHTDYDAMGVALIAALYLSRGDRGRQCALSALAFLAAFGVYGAVTGHVFSGPVMELCSLPAFYLIGRGSGERRTRVNRYVFYFFYPAHLLALYGLELLLIR